MIMGSKSVFRGVSFLILLLGPLFSAAQIAVSGKVTDAGSKEPLPGVSVLVQGSSSGTATDLEGNYHISVPQGATLVFTFLGYETQEVRVGDQTVINIALNLENSQLDEVVVVGYGTESRSNVATAIGSVNAEELTERPTSINLVQGLAGKVAGVSVMSNSGKPGGKPSIKIRGVGSINTSSDPLYVIDGIVGADPTMIDPTIVESMDILKDASASAIYGSRGANGVVVITTKKGTPNTSVITFNNTLSFGTLQRTPDILNADQALEMLRRQYDYPYRTNPDVPRYAPHHPEGIDFARKEDLFNPDGTPKYNTNWMKASTRTAVSHNHSLSFSGGKEDLSVLANVAYRNNEGIMLNSYDKRVSAYLNIGWQVKPWLHLQGMINAGANQGNNVDLDPLSSTALRKMSEMLPFLPIKYPDGTYSRMGDYPGAEDSENPVRLLNEIDNVVGRSFSLANMTATFRLSDKVDFVTTFGAQVSSGYDYYYAGTTLRGVSESQRGVARRLESNSGGWTNEDYVSYRDSFGKHSLNVIGGASWYYNRFSSTQASAENFFDDYYRFNSLQAGSVRGAPISTPGGNQMNSFYSRVNYNYDGRYLLGASFRLDGSSRFGSDKKYGSFPSFSAGWNISNEQFFSDLRRTVSNLKLRASYGVVGNAEIGDYVTLPRLNNQQVAFDGQVTSVVVLGSLANTSLTWESSEQLDIGIDLALFNDRVEIIADYYNKVNRDLLYFRVLPITSGFSGVYDNIGDIRNRGFEIGVNTVNIHTNDLQWRTGVTFSRNRSKVLNLNGDILYPWSIRVMEGRPLNEFYGYKREGIWGTDEAEEAAKYGRLPGDVKWQDTNNNGMKDPDDRVVLGNGMPDFELNMVNTVSFKGFSLLLDLQSMYGLSLSNTTKHLMQNAATRVNSYTDILNAWTPDNQQTMVPALRTASDHGSPSEVADSYAVEDASFIRVRNIGLTYRLNPEWLSNILIKNLTLGLNVENAFLFTRYSGFDPEYTSLGSQLEQGVDIYQYPKPRTFSFSLNANF